MYLVFFAFGGFPGFNGLIHEQYTYVCVYKYVRQTLFLGNLEDDFAPIRDIIKNIHWAPYFYDHLLNQTERFFGGKIDFYT